MPNKEKKRIGLVGPVRPFRGGIAQHTTMLRLSLKEKADLQSVSFRKLYPGWLYPGRGLYEPGREGHCEEGVSYMIEPLNPVSWQRACRLLMRHEPEAVAIAWWTAFLAPCIFEIARRLRRRGIGIIFICHNVSEHEPSPLKSLLGRTALSRGSGFVVQSDAEAGRLRSLIKNPRVAVYPHPVLTQFPPSRGKLPRRAGLELLFFGFVRPYKGLDTLLDAMEMLKDEDVFLTIAGEWWVKDAKLRRRAEEAESVEVMDRYIPEDEAGEIFGRADAVVLPYESATGSGVVPLAYRYGKPVIASRVGGLADVVEDGKSGLLFRARDAGSLAGAIRQFLENRPHMHEGVGEAAARMTWDGLADCVLRLAGEAAGR